MDEKKAHSNAPHGGKDSAGHGNASNAQQNQQKGGAPQQGGAQKGPVKPGEQRVSTAPKKDYGEDFRGIVRIAGKDLKGEIPLRRAITKVRGVGERLGVVMAEVAISQLKLPNDIVVGLLSEEQLQKLEEMLMHPTKYGVPGYMLNRQKDPQAGGDIQIIGNDVRFYMGQDIDHDKGINSWRGYRHLYGQKVRGQHTRTTGRTGMTVGVLRKAIISAKATAAAEAQGKPGAAPVAGGAPIAPKGGAAAIPKGGAGAPAAGGAKPAAGTPAAKPGEKKPEAKK